MSILGILETTLLIVNLIAGVSTIYKNIRSKNQTEQPNLQTQSQQVATIQSGDNSNNQIIQIDNPILNQELTRQEQNKVHQARIKSIDSAFKFFLFTALLISIGVNLLPVINNDYFLELQFFKNDVIPLLIEIINTCILIFSTFIITFSVIGLFEFLLPFGPKRPFDDSSFKNFIKKCTLVICFSCSLIASLIYVFNKNKIDAYAIINLFITTNNSLPMFLILALLGSAFFIFSHLIQIILADNILDNLAIFLTFIFSIVFLFSSLYITGFFSIAF